ncbi:MAG: tRNA (adenosine(37)-N6)-threonylcarbamoyltransferase complex dimerization subunit type 1 TsaB [Litorimonas sp.]
MIILGLDTTGPYCSVSIVDTATIRAHKSVPMMRGHAEALAPMVQDVLDMAKLSPKDIDKIAVCTGPGSFTGLRVALAFAKGFALPRKTPVIGVSSLAIWAAQYDPEGNKSLVCISDVRRGELCWAAISNGQLIYGPATQEAARARGAISALKPDEVIEDAVTDTRILAWMSADLSPKDAPATPLYSRGPDAKLPSKFPKSKPQYKSVSL